VGEDQPGIEQRTGDGPAVDPDRLLEEVPAAWPDRDRGGPIARALSLALGGEDLGEFRRDRPTTSMPPATLIAFIRRIPGSMPHVRSPLAVPAAAMTRILRHRPGLSS
jgi:hypothetical protein